MAVEDGVAVEKVDISEIRANFRDSVQRPGRE
jgi:hypothetical protein